MGRELKNEFSWSKSRDETFHECLRKYWFHYYGSWGGWDKAADRRARQIYILKNLQTRQMWAGDRVHRAIRDVLAAVRRGGEPPAEQGAVEQLLEAMRRDFRDSRARKYRDNPKKTCGLFEHEYDVQLPDGAWKETADHAAACLRAFYGSGLLKKIRALPAAAWLELEELASFTLDGLKVYVQLDFAYRDSGQVFIYDWKTGRLPAEQNELQLACYVLYAMGKWAASPSQVTATAYYLASEEEYTCHVDEERLETMKEYIRDSADEMLFPLSDPETNAAEEKQFDLTEDSRACKRCNFLKVCPRFA